MKVSVFDRIWQFVVGVVLGFRSILGSCLTALPYLFRWKEQHKEVTEGYPDPVSSKTADDLPPRTRGLLFNDIDRCTGCRDCEVICPVQCIHIESEPSSEPGKIWVSSFDIDHSKCVYCGLCVDRCIPASLVHTRNFEGAAYHLEDLVANFGRGSVTEEQRVRWAEMRGTAEAEEDASL